jgi:hypothetical protein
VVTNDSAIKDFDIQPRGICDAIEEALVNEDRDFAETRWSDALSSSGAERNWGGVRFGSRLVDSREICLPVPEALAFKPVQRIGGTRGWYYGNILWRIRGFLDLLAGGVGMRRGRNHPEEIHIGEPIDFWRVEDYQPGKRLRLYAEMKLPGRAWLEFEVEAHESGSVLRQTAEFDPVGLAGLIYWYGIYPVHSLVFAGMLRGIARTAVEDI